MTSTATGPATTVDTGGPSDAGDLALAVDFGGTKVEAALVDRFGAVVPGTRSRAGTGQDRSSDALADSVRSVCLETMGSTEHRSRVVGIGVGAAGPVDEADGLVSPLNLPAWRDFPLRTLIETTVPGLPVTVRMDGLCITLAEHWVGAARGYDNVMGMIVSTGVGGGLILGGRTFSGPTGNAGHIGHLEVGGFDDPCSCGGTGCAEAVASGPRSVAWARRQGWTGTSGEELAVGYAAGDPIAVAAVQRSGRAIGQAIAAATSLVDLDIVAIGGGFSQVSPDFFDAARTAVAARAAFPFVTKVVIVPSGLSGDGPLIGAGALVHRADRLS